ncbi:pyridoxamine 5'-phosphate oxidase family protein [Streptomyces sp. GC420]|uniref:pyridoxamine 5'-phosphate oxidase family protein n=1 Tax=Streptomyces sp. GC420 TaxID=2697568 RepID=UPI001414D781|nr:pyridoxamine 5'-phosphate oxidase family protein [Streptomyces sp. GC420]NBM15869.1 pyridoxamine 5'-phosphate oxidase family protein [Streptomyces sp. GC420]
MPTTAPATTLDRRYSDPDAAPVDWATARRRLEDAELFWLTTVRPDGCPHVTPLIAVWLDGALHFGTGPRERKALNLSANRNVVLTTGTNTLHEGLDLVVEGRADRVTDEARLLRLARAWEAKYGPDWRFDVRDGSFWSDHGPCLVFAVTPETAFGFAKGTYGQTRWRF